MGKLDDFIRPNRGAPQETQGRVYPGLSQDPVIRKRQIEEAEEQDIEQDARRAEMCVLAEQYGIAERAGDQAKAQEMIRLMEELGRKLGSF
jgi:hypothetical protein